MISLWTLLLVLVTQMLEHRISVVFPCSIINLLLGLKLCSHRIKCRPILEPVNLVVVECVIHLKATNKTHILDFLIHMGQRFELCCTRSSSRTVTIGSGTIRPLILTGNL